MNEKPAKLITYLLPKHDNKVLLVKYRDSPNPKRSGWWIPAPELDYGQHPDECAKTITASIGCKAAEIAFHGVDSFVTRDWHVLFLYSARTEKDVSLTLDKRYETAAWFNLDALPDASEFAHGQWEIDLVRKLAII